MPIIFFQQQQAKFLIFECITNENNRNTKKEESNQMILKVTDADFKKVVLESDMPVLVDFWAEWCSPCQMVGPVVEAIADKHKDQLKVCKVNVDEAGKAASEYDIMSIPALVVFKGGQAVDKIIGAVPEATLEATVQKHI